MIDETYWPTEDRTYYRFVDMYREWFGADLPNPCRKYHVSVDESGAARAAAVALEILREMRLHHKVVTSLSELRRQNAGSQAGKFITIYAPEDYEAHGILVVRLSGALAKANVRPGPAPRMRAGGHQEAEPMLDEKGFVYGGYVTNPGA